ncbi:hypothetical protein TNCV_4916061 [Trichonephila clavipes]|nr:hypothetical protein TNCV_4916061 [Trichonephila clavipes]
MKIDEIDERIIFDTLDQEVGISSSTVNSEAYCGTFFVDKIDKNKIEGKINNENEPVDQFEAFIEQLNDKESNLSLLNTLSEDRLSVDTITEDIEASEEIKRRLYFGKRSFLLKLGE